MVGEGDRAEPASERAELAGLARALRAHAQRAARRSPKLRRSAAQGAHGAGDEASEAAQAAAVPVAAPGRGVPAEALRPAAPGSPARTLGDVRAQAAAAGSLDELRASVARCEACELCTTRTQTVFQDGEGTRGILFVGEAPGADEDRTGVPFVGRAGQLLTDIITKGMGLAREEVFIANVLKCRPPENRDPTPAEKERCTPWLDRQIELMNPRLLIPLGRHAALHVLGGQGSMASLRGRVHERRGRQVVATYHPAYLLRNPAEKKECWKDIQLAMQTLGMPPRDAATRA